MSELEACPHCGHRQDEPRPVRWWAVCSPCGFPLAEWTPQERQAFMKKARAELAGVSGRRSVDEPVEDVPDR